MAPSVKPAYPKEGIRMRFFEQNISDVFVIEPESFADVRGMFRRHFLKQEFAERGLKHEVVECNISENTYKHTLRGLHFQLPPFSQAKTLSCLRGCIYDVVLDLRPESSTYMKWLAVELDEENRRSIYVPPGCANAFLTMENNSLIHYYVSQCYMPNTERGIRYNDPTFKFIWPVEPRVISEKDRNHPDFNPVGHLKLMRGS